MAVTRSTLALTRALRAHAGTELDGVDRHLAHRWVQAWDRIAAAWQAAAADLAGLAAADGAWPTRNRIFRSEATLAALTAAGTELDALAAAAIKAAAAGARALIDLDIDYEPRIIASQAPAAQAEALEAHLRRRTSEQDTEHPDPIATGDWGPAAVAGLAAGRFDPSAIVAIFARTEGQITSALWPLSAGAIEAMRLALIKGVTVGDNPVATARDMVDRVQSVFNGGLDRAITIARTEMLDAFRSASAYAHRANADLVTAWQWYAKLDSRTCFPAGTLVRTRRGEIPIETVSVGDEVLSHTGTWQRVYDTTSRAYLGRLVTIEAGPLRVSATVDHPFLIERDGRLAWIAAGDIRVGDSVLSDRQLSGDEADHRFGEVAVERCGDNPHHCQAATCQERVLAGIAGGDLRVPVGLVDFESDTEADQEEVHGARPSFDGGLLDEGDSKALQREADVPLGDGLPGVAPVAADRAEPLVAHRRHDTELRSTGGARVEDRRPPAELAAMPAALTARPESLATARAVPVEDVLGLAFDRADVVAVGVGAGDRECLPAPGTDLRDGLCSCTAGRAAELPGATARGEELVPAMAATTHDPRFGLRAPASVRVGPLVGAVAGTGTELRSPGANPRRRSIEGPAAYLASPLHRNKVTAACDMPAALRVYNLEVEDDHSYIADGFAVHNCAACWSRHGTIHPISDPGPDDHPRGRCTRLPVLRPWAELGITAKEPPSAIKTGDQVFARLPRSRQLEILGKRRLELLDAGDITWPDLARWRQNPDWRRSNQPTSIRDLQRLADQRAESTRREEHRVP